MYTSTRKKLSKNASFCITQGISEEGGLFILDSYDNFSLSEKMVDLTYQELSKKILKYFLNDFNDKQIEQIISETYNKQNFCEKMIGLKNLDEVNFLELYYGPTMAFKDMALTILPQLLITSKNINGNKKKTLILTATSGDTGGATLSGFKDLEDVKVIVLYPTKGVSIFQEQQMHYYTGKNAMAIAVEGNFDDCQNLVKKVFTSDVKLKNLEFSSANSINIGRLIPQIVYYFYAYFEMIRKGKIKYGEQINYVVPTGNFGNILACYIAKKMGLFINKIVCASNENSVLTDFFNTLVYDKNRTFHLTNSPAMDILISSNLERLLYLITNNNEGLVAKLMQDLQETGVYSLPIKYKENLADFLAYSVTKEDTIKYIKEVYQKHQYLIDPHTAVAYGAYTSLKNQLKGQTIIVSTASPYKFLETVDKIFKTGKEGIEQVQEIEKITKCLAPKVLYNIYNSSFKKIVWKKDEMEDALIKLIGEIDENC